MKSALALLLAGLAVQRDPRAPQAQPPTRVLFVGNSYTYFNDLPAMVSALAEAGGHRLETKMIAPGGWRLRDHFEKGEARSALHEGHWDFVVLQEQSTLGTNLYLDGQPRVGGDEIFRPAAEAWAQEIAQAGAKPVFYLTWAHKKTPADQATLTSAVRRVAEVTHALVAPAGPAWTLVREARPSLELYYTDGSHPSPAGSYLAACTLYATLFHASPVGLPGKVSGAPVDLDTEQLQPDKVAVLAELGADDARALQEAAWRAVEELAQAGPAAVVAAPELAPLPRGAPLTESALAGGWEGSLAFSPTGPATLTLAFDPPTTKESAWSGHARLEFHSKDAPDVELDFADLKVTADELAFSIPHAAFELDVRFRLVLLASGELSGHAQASRDDGDARLRLLGSCMLRRAD